MSTSTNAASPPMSGACAALEPLVILSASDQAYLLRAIESVLQVRDLRQLFRWTQDQLQTLLPHRIMVCMRFGADGALLRLECLHGTAIEAVALRRLGDPHAGLAVRLARHLQAAELTCAGSAEDLDGAALAQFRTELRQLGQEQLIVHASGPLAGGSSAFVLFGLPSCPQPRQAHFFALLLPYLHLFMARIDEGAAAAPASDGMALTRPLSARETEILAWLREGKSNYEVGRILGISALTVKNHLQRSYRVLGVSNRTHALARCLALHLLAPEAAAETDHGVAPVVPVASVVPVVPVAPSSAAGPAARSPR